MAFRDQVKADLRSIFSSDELDEPVEYRFASGTVQSLRGIFTRKGYTVDPDTEAVVASTALRVRLIEADLAEDYGPGDTCTIGGTQYEVVDYDPDEGGTIVMQLERT